MKHVKIKLVGLMTAISLLAAAPAFVLPAAGWETGQLLIKDKPRYGQNSGKIRVCSPSKSTEEMQCRNIAAAELAVIPGLKGKKAVVGEQGCWYVDPSQHWVWKAPCPL